MNTIILRVLAQGEVYNVPSKKSENGQLAKCVIRLKELGEVGDEYLVTILGNMAQCRFPPDSIVAASLRFKVHESNGQFYQDILANEIKPLK
jgi:hypothetical protein